MSEESTGKRAIFDPKLVEVYSKTILAFATLFGLFWGVFKYFDSRERELLRYEADRKQQIETRRIEATRPYLERQLELYTEATQVAALIATEAPASTGSAAPDTARNLVTKEERKSRFWQLYWGEMALVEDERVEKAMAEFGDALLADAPPEVLKGLSLALSHACRDSLAESWAVKEWRRPTYDSRTDEP